MNKINNFLISFSKTICLIIGIITLQIIFESFLNKNISLDTKITEILVMLGIDFVINIWLK
jgi:hypothetical protein